MPPKYGISKVCERCGSRYYKPIRASNDEWFGRKYCSKLCSNRATAVKTPLEERFWKFVKKRSEGCWGWIGGHDDKGYGSISRGSASEGRVKAHRLSWELHFGPIPDGLEVLHLCDNPECNNPDHLAIGTHRANMFDCGRKGRVHANSIANLRMGNNT